jgi:hypothetical protein
MSICPYHLKTHVKRQGFETRGVENIRGEWKKDYEAILKGFFSPLYHVV